MDATEPAPHAVLAAANQRARALSARDESALRALLHPAFGWTSHTGAHFDRERYIRSNFHGTVIDGAVVDGATIWHGQHLEDATVTIECDTAVLYCIVADDVTVDGRRRMHRMPMTQTWVRVGERWQLLAGHAGPLLGETLVTG